MPHLLTLAGCVLGGLACLLWYAAHPNQRLRTWSLARPWRWAGHGLALASLLLLAAGLGTGPGLIAGLCLLQLGVMTLPYLTLRRGDR